VVYWTAYADADNLSRAKRAAPFGYATKPSGSRKCPPTVPRRVFAIRPVIVLAALPLAYITAGPLVDQIFNPLLTPDGGIAQTLLGRLIGFGSDRGIGLMFLVVGLICLLGVVSGYLIRWLCNTEAEPLLLRNTGATKIHSKQQRIFSYSNDQGKD
jgi:hypothetical protein